MGEEADGALSMSDEGAPTRGDAERVLRITAINNRFDGIPMLMTNRCVSREGEGERARASERDRQRPRQGGRWRGRGREERERERERVRNVVSLPRLVTVPVPSLSGTVNCTRQVG